MDITALLIGLVLGVLAAALWFIMQNRRKESESANLLQRLSILEEQRTALDNENRENRNRLQETGAELAAARENVRNLNQRLAEKDAEVQKNEQQLREAFGKMAFENVQRQSQVLREQHT